MKILVILGSPKGRGDGYKVIQRVEAEMKKLGDVHFEYLFLKDANLELCRGCFLCVTQGEDLCPLQDDRVEIEEKILDSDGVILISPGYVYNVSWLMKNFIDRFAYTNHRPRFFDQKLMLIANAGAGMEKTIESLRNTFGIGPDIVHELAYMSPPWLLSDKIRFKFFKTISQSVKDYLPADYEYYKDKNEYYYDTKVNLLKKVIAWFMLKASLFFMRDMAPKDSN